MEAEAEAGKAADIQHRMGELKAATQVELSKQKLS